MLVPQFIDLLWDAGQRLLPARLCLINGTTVIGAELVGKTMDLDFGQASFDCTPDDVGPSPDTFLVGHT